MFITATIQTIVSGTPSQAGRSTAPRNGNVKWSIHTPNAVGIAAATTCPASFGAGARPRKSSIAPTTQRDGRAEQDAAHLAREVEEGE